MAVADTLNNRFLLPDMGDYYYDCVDPKFYTDIDNLLNPVRKNISPAAAAKFYLEEPPELGYDDKYSVYTVGINLNGKDRSKLSGQFVGSIDVDDGDTVRFNANSIISSDEKTKTFIDSITNDTRAKLSSYGGFGNNNGSNSGVFEIRFACIDTKEVPHFYPSGSPSMYKDYPKDKKKYSELSTSTSPFSGDEGYVFSKWHSFLEGSEPKETNTYNIPMSKSLNGSEGEPDIDFVKIDGTWYQYFVSSDNMMYILAKDDSSPQAEYMADAGVGRDTVVKAIKDAEEVRVMINAESVNRVSADKGYTTIFRTQKNGSDAYNLLKRYAEELSGNEVSFLNTGFNICGMDVYGRAIAVIYVKLNGKWVNLSKFVITNTENTNINETAHSSPDQARNDGYYSRAFDSNSYEFDEAMYASDLYEQSGKFDDREKIHQEIFKNIGKPTTMTDLKKWTMTIGDVVLFVPPTAIRCITQSKSNRLPIMRAKGTMAKSAHKIQKILEVDLFFNNARGINGYDYETKLPNGKDITYAMNGLRALVAQFKLIPFLPIDNEHINKVLDIDAVTMNNLQISTVPGFHTLLRATIQMAAFDYRVFMPEIPLDEDDVYSARNYFSRQINYPIFRYYYQRLIQNGNVLQDTPFLDDKFITSTFGNKTCMIPMKFKDADIKFYIPNKEKLDKMKQVKMKRMQKAATPVDLTKKQLNGAKDLGSIYKAVKEIDNGSSYGELNDLLSGAGDGLYLFSTKKKPDISVRRIKFYDKAKTYGLYQDGDTRFFDAQIESRVQKILEDYKGAISGLTNSNGSPLCLSIEISKPTMYLNGNDEETAIPNEISNNLKGYSTTARVEYTLNAKLDLSYMTDDEINALRTYASQSQSGENSNKNGTSYSAQEIFNDKTVHIPVSFILTNANNVKSTNGYSYSSDNGLESSYIKALNYSNGDNGKTDVTTYAVPGKGVSMDFLAFNAAIDDQQGLGGNEAANELKGQIDYETANTIKFEQFNIGSELRITDIQIGMGNTFSQMTLQQTEGFAPQFMGGTDTQITFSAYTTSEKAAAAMNALPKIAANFAREYKIILTCWPLKIESEITKLIGVNDVLIESVQVDTVPNMPGLYKIQMALISVDRTLRNRETMKKTDLKNFKSLTVEGQGASRTIEYDQISSMLSEAELYPDLELPTINEFDESGFRFIRYTNQKRKYPDPDFYFTYSYTLVSQIIRESVINGLKEKISDVTLKDNVGHTLNGSLLDGFGKYESNFKKDAGWNKTISETFRGGDAANNALALTDFMYEEHGTFGRIWRIAPNVKISLCEKDMASILSDQRKIEDKAARLGISVEECKQQEESSSQKTKSGAEQNASSAATTDGSMGVLSTSGNQTTTRPAATAAANQKKDPRVDETAKEINPYAAKQWQDKANAAVKMIDDILDQPIKGYIGLFKDGGFSSKDYDINIANDEDSWELGKMTDIISNGDIDTSPLEKLGMSTKPAKLKAFLYAAACALSANGSEYSNNASSASWQPIYPIHGICSIDGQIENISCTAKDSIDAKKGALEKIAKYAMTFGPFNMKMYTEDQLKALLCTDTVVLDDAEGQEGRYLLDPYYRNAEYNTIAHYKALCCKDHTYAMRAFWRLCLLWLKQLIQLNIMPSFAFDIFRDTLKSEARIRVILNAITKAKREQRAETLKQTQIQAKNTVSQTQAKDSADASSDNKTTAQQTSETKSNEAKAADAIKTAQDQAKAAKAAEEEIRKQEDQENNAMAKQYTKFFNDNCEAVDNGKIFLITAMAVLDGSSSFIEMLKNRSYETLNALTQSFMAGTASDTNNDSVSGLLRKFSKALVGAEVIKTDQLGAGDTTGFGEIVKKKVGRKNQLAASNDPQMYLVHSFYDMVVRDCRGRMLRAFPTFYMTFIDEGRKIGKWKLHDNFYNTNAISEITITRSKKIASDTAQVTMSNFFQTFTTDDEDMNSNYTVSYWDVVRSIFLPLVKSYAEEQESKRENAAPVERMHIRPGVRIQIRIGYGGDASALPVSFNGFVSEIEAGDIVNFVAQGDGVEIAKPILLDKMAHEIATLDDFFDGNSRRNGATPKTILDGLLTTHGGAFNETMHEKGYDDLANSFWTPVNPFGIYHFGNSDFNYINGEPEPTQNIFEISGLRLAEKQSTNGQSLNAPDLPMLEFEIFGKSVWDIMHIVKGVVPDYMTSVVPFGYRSSVFFGRPHDYYAYDYQNINGEWYEKRKPFQQYHIYSSLTDIMSNQVVASPKYIKTCAVGLYEVQGSFNTKSQQRTDPMWVDKEIFPESQKTMYFDTKLYGAAAKTFGWGSSIVNFFTSSITNNFFDRAADETGQVRNHHAIARMMTIDALKKSVNDMYQGPLVVIGDPTVKPYDRILIDDSFQEINGQVLVRDVVETLSAENGYTTTIYPDLIATTKDGAEEEIKATNAASFILQAVIGWRMCTAAMLVSTIFKAIALRLSSGAPSFGIGAATARNLGAEALATARQYRQLTGLLGSAEKAGDSVKKIWGYAKTGGATLSKLSNLTGIIGAVKAVAGYFVVGCVADWIETAWNSRRVLTLFPLMHYGRVMTAGIEGNTGLCYGSPNYKDEGFARGIIGWLGSSPIANMLGQWFGDKGPVHEAVQYNKSYMDNQLTREGLSKAALEAADGSCLEMFSRAKINPIVPRMELNKKESKIKAQKAYGISGTSPEAISRDPHMQQMRPVFSSIPLKDYMDCGFFRIASREKGFDQSLSDSIQCIYVTSPTDNANEIPVNALVGKDDDGNTTYDIPFLHRDAIGILDEVVKGSFDSMLGTEQTRDTNKWYKDNAGSYLVLKSALKAGSTKSYENTGFSFILEASDDKSSAAMGTSLVGLQKQFKEIHEKNAKCQESIFSMKLDGRVAYIVVMPPEGV